MATIEMVNIPADGDGPGGQFHSSELRNFLHAANGCGVLVDSLNMTVTGSDRLVTFPAFDAIVPDGTNGRSVIVYAGGNATITAADATNPRIDIIVIDINGTLSVTAGTPTAETGDVEEAPMPTLNDDEILLAKVRVEANTASIGTDKVFGRAINVNMMAVNGVHYDQQLSAGQVNALLATNIQLVPALGGNTVAVIPTLVHLFLDHGGTDFVQTAGSDHLAIRISGGAEIQELGSEAQCTALLEASADAALAVPITSAFVPVVNTAIVLDNNGAAEYTTGNGTLSVRTYFNIVPMNAFGA